MNIKLIKLGILIIYLMIYKLILHFFLKHRRRNLKLKSKNNNSIRFNN